MTSDVTPRSLFVTAQDGLRLHVREYGLRTAPALPVVCLPGLSRTVADFDGLAPALANAYFKASGKRIRTLPFFPAATMGGLANPAI